MGNIIVGCSVRPRKQIYVGVFPDRVYKVYGIKGTLINIVSSWGNEKWLKMSNFEVVQPFQEGGDGWTTP